MSLPSKDFFQDTRRNWRKQSQSSDISVPSYHPINWFTTKTLKSRKVHGSWGKVSVSIPEPPTIVVNILLIMVIMWLFMVILWLMMVNHILVGGWAVPLWKMVMDQYLLIPFLVGWTSIYQLFWCSPGVQGFDTLPNMLVSRDDDIPNIWKVIKAMFQTTNQYWFMKWCAFRYSNAAGQSSN